MRRGDLICAAGISIHALREEGDGQVLLYSKQSRISIHALREEGDYDTVRMGTDRPISIHALREEGDTFFTYGM